MYAYNVDKIIQRLEYLGITKGELAESLNVAPATVTKIIQNQLQYANFEVLYGIHKKLGLSIDQIIIDISKPNKEQDNTIESMLIEIGELSDQLNAKIKEYQLRKGITRY